MEAFEVQPISSPFSISNSVYLLDEVITVDKKMSRSVI
jgi:hypothetical protein